MIFNVSGNTARIGAPVNGPRGQLGSGLGWVKYNCSVGLGVMSVPDGGRRQMWQVLLDAYHVPYIST